MESIPYYKTRDTSKLTFYIRNRPAIWFYGIASGVIGLGIIPWAVGWYNIIF